MSAPFGERFLAACQSRDSHLCVGLDPIPEELPEGFMPDPEDVLRWATAVVEATAEVAAAFKPNSAFYEAMGAAGMEVLQAVIAAMPPDAVVILDAKRGDVGHTAERYAAAAFEVLGAHAVTVSPYLGEDSLEPFLRRPERGAFVLCRTSNPGAAELQDLRVDGARPLYLEVARRAATWNTRGNVGLVAGATWPGELATIREVAPGLPFLVPGAGAQGGDVAAAARAAAGPAGDRPFVISASRSLTRPAPGEDLQAAAATAARRLRDEINAALAATPRT